jgi:hypothetical protein
MKSIKAFSKAVLLCGGVIVASSAVQAETISQNAGVSVIRGDDNADAAAQRQNSRGRAGVAIFRGQSTDGPANAAPAAGATTGATQQIVGGQSLWVHDADANSVTACNLRYDVYGNQKILCRSDRQ